MIDTQNQTAEWWAEQAHRYKAEVATISSKYDALVKTHADQLEAHAKKLKEFEASKNEEIAKQSKEHAVKIEQLKKDYDASIVKIAMEPIEIRTLRESHEREMNDLKVAIEKSSAQFKTSVKEIIGV